MNSRTQRGKNSISPTEEAYITMQKIRGRRGSGARRAGEEEGGARGGHAGSAPAAVPRGRAICLPSSVRPRSHQGAAPSVTGGPHDVGRRQWPGGAAVTEGERRPQCSSSRLRCGVRKQAQRRASQGGGGRRSEISVGQPIRARRGGDRRQHEVSPAELDSVAAELDQRRRRRVLRCRRRHHHRTSWPLLFRRPRGHPASAPPPDPQPLAVSTRRSRHGPPRGRSLAAQTSSVVNSRHGCRSTTLG
jgi:hypothetical protein